MLLAADKLHRGLRTHTVDAAPAFAVCHRRRIAQGTHSLGLMDTSFAAWYQCHAITLFIFL